MIEDVEFEAKEEVRWISRSVTETLRYSHRRSVEMEAGGRDYPGGVDAVVMVKTKGAEFANANPLTPTT